MRKLQLSIHYMKSMNGIPDLNWRVSQDQSDMPQAYAARLKEEAQYLFTILPSDVDPDRILKLEEFLNDMYYQAYLQNWPEDIKKALLTTLSQAGELCYKIKNMQRKSIFNAGALKTIKQFAHQFEVLSYFLQSV